MPLSVLYHDTFNTPAGPFSIAVNEAGEVLATAFGDVDALRGRLGREARRFTAVRGPEAVAFLRAQVEAWFAGEAKSFSYRAAVEGTLFQNRVWRALEEIPFGHTRSYGEVAAALGSPGASRAVGRANGTNPLCLLVPCHRVIGADGSLTGFAFGETVKRKLLEFEGAI